MLLPRLIIIFLFAGVILKSTLPTSDQIQSDTDNIGLMEEGQDDLTDENTSLFSIDNHMKNVSITVDNISEKIIERPPFTETPPPEFV